VDLVFELAVRRGEHLLDDVLTQLLGVVLVDADTVRLPMRCRFVGEEGVDQGGLRKELFSLAMKQLVLLTNILKPTS
jgi:ubiquitin-protein ligase E3 A